MPSGDVGPNEAVDTPIGATGSIQAHRLENVSSEIASNGLGRPGGGPVSSSARHSSERWPLSAVLTRIAIEDSLPSQDFDRLWTNGTDGLLVEDVTEVARNVLDGGVSSAATIGLGSPSGTTKYPMEASR